MNFYCGQEENLFIMSFKGDILYKSQNVDFYNSLQECIMGKCVVIANTL